MSHPTRLTKTRASQSRREVVSRLVDRSTAPHSIRLNKYLSLSGVASRRKADEMIASGQVTVNGVSVRTLGFKIDSTRDKVFVSGKEVVQLDDLVYVLLHKPKDCITTTRDEKGRRSVLDLVRVKQRIYPVGRLDRNTTGVLLLTNDGELANRLMHPRYGLRKVYHVELEESLSCPKLELLRSGIQIDGEKLAAEDISIIPRTKRRVLEFVLREGKNREVRRMVEAVGGKVRKLHRIAYGSITAEGLSRGEWRFLSRREVQDLKHQVGIS
jgi:23S rRNA pseudouridine2605 synthase